MVKSVNRHYYAKPILLISGWAFFYSPNKSASVYYRMAYNSRSTLENNQWIQLLVNKYVKTNELILFIFILNCRKFKPSEKYWILIKLSFAKTVSTVQLGDTQWHYGAVDLPKQQTPGSKILADSLRLITDWLSKTLMSSIAHSLKRSFSICRSAILTKEQQKRVSARMS